MAPVPRTTGAGSSSFPEMAGKSRAAPPPRARGWPTTLVIAAAALLLAMIVVRNTVAAAFSKSSPEAVLRVAPGNAAALIARVTEEAVANGGRIDPAMLTRARAALEGSPLAAEPLAFLAIARSDPTLAAAALRRDPRSRSARLILVEQALRDRRYPEALSYLDRLILLEPEARARFFAAIAAIAGDPASRPALVSLMDSKPSWRLEFLETLNQQRADPALIFRLTQGPAGDKPLADEGKEQASLLQGLVAKGDYERAYLAWINFLPPSALESVALVYDGAFEQRPGPPPFNWALKSNENGSAEFSQPHGIRGDFFGSSPSTFAEQVLLLAPGSYRLALKASGSGNAAAGHLGWRLSCIGGAEIGQVDLAGLGERPSVRAMNFAIPADGCKAQRLALVGEPAEFPAPVSATTTNISIAPMR